MRVKIWSLIKKRSSEFLGVKREIFFREKRHSEMLVREKLFRPPKLGARSPPLQARGHLGHPVRDGRTENAITYSELSFSEPIHVSALTRSCYYHLRQLLAVFR